MLEVLELEKCLKKYKDAELDIELLRRKNDKLCFENNIEIEKLEVAINAIEKSLEEDLKESGEDKLECKLGSISFKKMPDEWIYVDEILMAWIISLPEKLKRLYLKITTTIKKAELKKQIMLENEMLFEKSKLIEDPKDVEIELFLIEEKEEFAIDGSMAEPTRDYKVEGIEIKRQEPKFSINIKKKK